ncbi:15452_t:CDS:1, partial [Gigaspora rosea]
SRILQDPEKIPNTTPKDTLPEKTKFNQEKPRSTRPPNEKEIDEKGHTKSKKNLVPNIRTHIRPYPKKCTKNAERRKKTQELPKALGPTKEAPP